MFGDCCKDLRDAFEQPPNSFFRVDDEVLYLSIGYAQTDKGTGFFDQAVIFCPFCGSRLQTRDEIRKKAGR